MIRRRVLGQSCIMVDGANGTRVLVDNILNLRAESMMRGIVTFRRRAKKNFTNSSPMVGSRPRFEST
jgi:hypothetical protein